MRQGGSARDGRDTSSERRKKRGTFILYLIYAIYAICISDRSRTGPAACIDVLHYISCVLRSPMNICACLLVWLYCF